MMEDWIEHEMRNWSRWCNSGPFPHPRLPGSFLESWLIPDTLGSEHDDRPPPVHEENAKKVQTVYDASGNTEKKLMKAEWLAPWEYGRIEGGVPAAARKVGVSQASYEAILRGVKRRVERVFA
jgi:hypothetical protein